MLFLHFSGTQTLAEIRVQNYEFYLNWREKFILAIYLFLFLTQSVHGGFAEKY